MDTWKIYYHRFLKVRLGDQTMALYSLDDATRSFFDSDVSPSRQECDDLARSLLGGKPIVPSNIQGQFSYTVCSPQAVEARLDGERNSFPATNANIEQFRLKSSRIDIYVAQLAKAIHGDIAAETDYYGEIGQETGTSLAVYLIQKLPGVTYIELGNFSTKMLPEMASKQLKLVEDFAGYGKSRP